MSRDTLNKIVDRINEITPLLLKQFSGKHLSGLFKGKITMQQFMVLALLGNKGELKMSDIARYSAVTTAAMTGVVDKLVKAKYAVRVYDPDDRRVVNIKITPQGSLLVKRAQEERRNMIIRVFQKISEEDRENYLRIISKIRDILLEDEKKV